MEKLNDLTTTQFFRGTNRKGEYLDQLINKRMRLLYYRINNTDDTPLFKQSKHAIEQQAAKEQFFKTTDLYTYKQEMLVDINNKKKKTKTIEQTEIKIEFEEENQNNEEENEYEDQIIEKEIEELEEIELDNFEDIEYEELDDSEEETEIDESDDTRIKKFKSNIISDKTNYIVFQIEDNLIYEKDVNSLNKPNWLTDNIIMSFMQTFTQQNLLFLDYNKMSKLANYSCNNDNMKLFDIFPKVNYFFY